MAEISLVLFLQYRNEIPRRVLEPGYFFGTHSISMKDPLLIRLQFPLIMFEPDPCRRQLIHSLFHIPDLEIQDGKCGGYMILLRVNKYPLPVRQIKVKPFRLLLYIKTQFVVIEVFGLLQVIDRKSAECLIKTEHR